MLSWNISFNIKKCLIKITFKSYKNVKMLKGSKRKCLYATRYK